MYLRNTNFGVLIASLLEVYLSGTFLLVLPTSLPHLPSNLQKAVTCMVTTWNIDPIHIQNDVSILACFYSFSKCAAFIAPSLIFHHLFFLATSPRIDKHTVRRHNCIDWYPPLYARFITQEERIQCFKKMPISGKHLAKSLSKAGFFYTCKHF